ncbi:MAG: YraN family protein [Vulcanimicrobiaceae bacterium]
MPNSTSSKGLAGENRAIALLEAEGYRIIERNARVPGGEIDIVCLDGRTLVFVEVKQRLGRGFGSALGAVDGSKRERLRRAAADYAQVVAPAARFRFDVVALDGNRARLHRNAF